MWDNVGKEWVLNVFNGGFNSFGDAVKNLLGNIISWFLSLGKVVTQIIDAIFGTDWTGGLNSLQDEVLSWGKNENAITISREAPTIQSLTGGVVDTWNNTDAWNTGYSAGESLENSTGNMFGSEDLLKGMDNNEDLLKGMGDSLGGISDDTSGIADSVDKTLEELEYLRDIAEQEAINRFTTAEVKVDLTSHNNISSNLDLDGVISYLTEGVENALATAAEGVY